MAKAESQSKPEKKARVRHPKILLSKEKLLETEQEIAKRKLREPEVFTLPTSKRSIEDLTNYFVKLEEGTNKILPKEKRRYVIYLRKSTNDESKQVRSLEDQRTECLALAKSQGISIRDEDILEESASAKKSGNRKIFDDMLMGFRTGKYHGLISWSPDRISRNMKEAGEVIEMIDEELIQDLLFKTYQFENNPNGKMLLGILFATSKQYSDKLGVDVTRGISGNTKEGLYNGVVKKGYYVDSEKGYFIPDSYNWDLLREAVSMRLYKGKSNLEIAQFLNDSHFSARKNQDEEYAKVRVDKQMVGDIFADPFYFGLYQYGKNLANLPDLYAFLPLITPDEYIELNQGAASNFDKKFAGKNTLNKRLDYGLLRNKVICGYCDTPMQFQHQPIKRGKNKDKWLISFYCRNTECQRFKEEENKEKGVTLKHSIRAMYVMAAIEYTLRCCTNKSKEAYRLHIGKLELKLAQDRAIVKRKLTDAKAELRSNSEQYIKYQQFQIEHLETYKQHHKGKLEHHQSLIRIAEHSIKVCEEELEKLNVGLPSEEEFYELIDSYLRILLTTTDLMEQDAICKELVSNLRAGDDSVSVVTLNKPYDLLLDLSKISFGRGERI